MDSDGDGASDCTDRCPYDPSASKDRDADGVPDCGDPCPEDAGNRCVEPCPLDSDGDGIQDCTDPCPWGEAAGMPCVSPPKKEEECRPTGCSGQICADHAVVTTCEWREEYACYRLSRCERQADGGCAWVPTPELAACLAGDKPCGRPGEEECRSPRWFWTCGDPVCGGHRDDPTIVDCKPTELATAPCASAGATCDPGDGCNRLLRCATSDPTGGGNCPISRRRYKEDIRYLGSRDLQGIHDALMDFRLTTYRYRHEGDAARRHLGFIIEEVEPSPSVVAEGDTVDLYGYASMAVAALQIQARQIARLDREVSALREARAIDGDAAPPR
jgi:eight-cysteine-cluster-containing protein